MHRLYIGLLAGALGAAAAHGEAPSGLSLDGDADATLWLAARIPSGTGQTIYVEYLAPNWVEKDAAAAVREGGFELTDTNGGKAAPKSITIAANQDFFENSCKLVKIEYAGAFRGSLYVKIKLAEGKTTDIPLGAADKIKCRTGKVLVPGGIKLRTAADENAAAAGVAPCGSELNLYGGRCYSTPAKGDLSKTVVFVGALYEGRQVWVPAATIAGETFLEEGPPLAELYWGSDEYTGGPR